MKKPKSAPALADPSDLFREYQAALSKIEDPRLVILLAFNAYEEALRALAAWRLSCSVADLNKMRTAQLCDIVLAGMPGELATAADALNALRNDVAHRF